MSWEIKSLNDLCENVITGGTPSTKVPIYYNGEIPWLRTQEVTFNYIFDTEIKITEDGLNNSSAKWVKENSVIVAMYGNSAGRVAINKIPLTTNQACCNLIIDKNKADYRFVYYSLLKDYLILHSMAKGAAQNNLNAGQIKSYKINTPPLFVQQKIASILSPYDELIEKNLRQITLLEKAALLFYSEWFEHLRFPGHEHWKIKDGVPEEWERVSVPEIIEINPRTTVSKDIENTYVDMASLSEHSMVISDLKKKIGNSGSKFKNGDTLFARITPCLENGKTGFVNFLLEDETAIGSTEFIVLRPKNETPEFVYCLSRTYNFRENAIKSMVGSSGRQRVQGSCFDDFFLLKPSVLISEMFSKVVSPLFKQIRTLSLQNQKLKQARDFLLPKLMNGEVKV